MNQTWLLLQSRKTPLRYLALFTAPLLLLACARGDASSSTADVASGAHSWFVSAAASSPGNGSEQHPFSSLLEAEEASAPGDVIVVVPSEGQVLDGGLRLKPGQKLLGQGGVDDPSVRVPITNTTKRLDGIIVSLDSGNEVAYLHFQNLHNHAISGSDTDLTGTRLHDNLFTGAIDSEEILWGIRLDSETDVTEIEVRDSEFRDGEDLGAIQIVQRGTSSGRFEISGNTFSNLGGRGVHLLSEDQGHIEARISDSTADNIGRGDRNSDSILPHLRNQSSQVVEVVNYRYANSNQEGNRSNCGLEAFLEGAPFPAQEQWCDGCKLEIEIRDSQFDNPVTDGIQLINFGSNSELVATVRNTVVRGAKPQQVGGGISLLSQNEHNSGNRSRLLVENSDVIGSAQFGIAISDAGEGYTSTVDLGGGTLGSKGNNRIIESSQGEVRVIQAEVVARNNWWGRPTPRVELEGDRTSFDGEPVLGADPRPAVK